MRVASRNVPSAVAARRIVEGCLAGSPALHRSLVTELWSRKPQPGPRAPFDPGSVVCYFSSRCPRLGAQASSLQGFLGRKNIDSSVARLFDHSECQRIVTEPIEKFSHQ
ncbi:hypothetical protein C4D60_Mb00t19030 [Musa balbisiana]|uniref:Uncharacterized protein n=1 Tax=Musa balbisiana TaxID=52838 RepID=A0A4S8I5D3_MUSBA|nr:hypothetical protein C4D60_Mb00t19030 [Musa balbisiana]